MELSFLFNIILMKALTTPTPARVACVGGIIPSHETVRQWARKFSPQFAN
jgi:hypothetical protein